MDFDFIYIKRSAIKLWIARRAYILHFFFKFYIFLKLDPRCVRALFQKPGWTPYLRWDFPKAWVEFSKTENFTFQVFWSKLTQFLIPNRVKD